MVVGYGALCFKICKHTSAVDGVCCERFLSMTHALSLARVEQRWQRDRVLYTIVYKSHLFF